MKALVLGIVHRKGIAKSGDPYDFCMLKTLRPVEPVNTDRMTVRGVGLTEVEVQADPGVVDQLRHLLGKFPLELDLATDARPGRFGQLELVVTGVTPGAK